MVRTVWIGFVCLIAICGLAAYKIGFAAPAKSQAVSADTAVVIADAHHAPVIHATPAPQAAVAPQAAIAPPATIAPQAAITPQVAATPQVAIAPQASAPQAAPATQDPPTPTQDVTAPNDGPAAKTDRLDVDYLQDLPKQTLVHTIPIVISNPGIPAKAESEKAAPEKATKVTSRHWRASYARLTRRHYRHQREASQPQPAATEAKAGHTGGGLLGWLRSTASAK